ncbi:MAG TPA: iron ABC transporter substrate-binding protein [Candidatus Lumbricidophila sp.]|nr:iron ABC transporter substrate-binding protein [Candidatus Lumbricidophila sp.]
MRKIRAASVAAVLVAAVSALGLTACAPAGDSNALVVYNAQHEQLTKEWADEFTKQTGIKVVLRNGGDSELANQLAQEGSASKADVFLTENSPAMSIVEKAGLFAPVAADTIAQVPAQYRPASGDWVGIAARSTVLIYNPSLVDEANLPKSLLDLADPKWAAKWGGAPAGADFQAIVSAIVQTAGEAKAAEWLAAMAKQAKMYNNNIATMKAVNAGEIPMGVIYHYYWYRDQLGTKENSSKTKLHYFGNHDAGAFVSLSGGGVLKNAPHAEQAQQFLKFITGKQGQEILGTGYSMEYPVGSGVGANPALPPLDSLQFPMVDPSTLNGKRVIDLMTKAGLL